MLLILAEEKLFCFEIFLVSALVALFIWCASLSDSTTKAKRTADEAKRTADEAEKRRADAAKRGARADAAEREARADAAKRKQSP